MTNMNILNEIILIQFFYIKSTHSMNIKYSPFFEREERDYASSFGVRRAPEVLD